MNDHISRQKLARARLDGQAIEEKVARAMEQASMRRYASREGAPC